MASQTHTHADYGWIWEQKWYCLWGNPLGIPPPAFLPQVVCGQLPEACSHPLLSQSSLWCLSACTSCLLTSNCSALCVDVCMLRSVSWVCYTVNLVRLRRTAIVRGSSSIPLRPLQIVILFRVYFPIDLSLHSLHSATLQPFHPGCVSTYKQL